ncbi:hypothetical protein U0C82_03435 [Fulvimarina sp. 2208YS6-2-32]|uniref:Uncharacterized protein n=1 Tax=Fulvimarina uroteuthidis TaxID=3098149 RepID=A0ABU5HYQ5_9HYPH|nr:hypothetical protein [Fulvimarina sp. 2208YS6-2-32]MDY8108202.1 hypothetical protein [Fulvimarina sp. 2208YS6-2-32]
MPNSTQTATPSNVRQGLLLAAILVVVGGISFGAVLGWIIYGETIFRQAVADGWALCF